MSYFVVLGMPKCVLVRTPRGSGETMKRPRARGKRARVTRSSSRQFLLGSKWHSNGAEQSYRAGGRVVDDDDGGAEQGEGDDEGVLVPQTRLASQIPIYS